MSGWELAAIAAVVLAYAAASRLLDRTPVTAAIFFVSCGFVLGDKGLGWIDLGAQSESVRLLAEVTLTLVLFADASRIRPGVRLRKEVDVPARLLGIGLPLTILVGTLAVAHSVCCPSLSFAEALRACDRARAHRRGARPGGRDRPAPAVAHPAGLERRERD